MDAQQANAMRKELRNKIAALRKKVTAAREIITKLSRCQNEINRKIEAWQSAYTSFHSRPITGEIYVEDLFEGNIAESLSGEVPRTAEKMNDTSERMETLCAYVQNQIAELEEYIAELQIRINGLQAELNALNII